MGKNKLKKYHEATTYQNIIRPERDVLFKGWEGKGEWKSHFFGNDNEIVVELGAGKGETSLMLAQKYPEKNFIAVDIKVDRLLKGAKEAVEMELKNILFLRIQIEHIEYAFAENEIDEIWITFPDPFPTDRRRKKRMTSHKFIESYKKVLKTNGLIHLKTDSTLMFDFTKEVLEDLKLTTHYETRDVYAEEQPPEDVIMLQTYYEKKWLEEGKKIKYLNFNL